MSWPRWPVLIDVTVLRLSAATTRPSLARYATTSVALSSAVQPTSANRTTAAKREGILVFSIKPEGVLRRSLDSPPRDGHSDSTREGAPTGYGDLHPSARRRLPLLDPPQHLLRPARVVKPLVQDLPGLGVDDDLVEGVAVCTSRWACGCRSPRWSRRKWLVCFEDRLAVLGAEEDVLVDCAFRP